MNGLHWTQPCLTARLPLEGPDIKLNTSDVTSQYQFHLSEMDSGVDRLKDFPYAMVHSPSRSPPMSSPESMSRFTTAGSCQPMMSG